MRRLVIIALAAATFSTGFIQAAPAATRTPHHADAPSVGASAPGLATAPPEIGEIIFGRFLVGRYLGAQHELVVAYLQAAHDAQVAAEAAEAAREAATAPRPTTSSPAPTSTGACGGATNGADQYITRESGGDPTVLNGGAHADTPFNGSDLAFGCYQIMPGTWTGACSDITTYDPASQAACASRLPGNAWAY